MQVFINKKLELIVDIENEETLMCAVNRIEHTHDIDISRDSNNLIVRGDDYDILTLLYQLSVAGVIELR